MSDLRIYSPDDLGPDGYPFAWHHDHWENDLRHPPIKDQIRESAGHRCERCGHPYSGRKRDPRISQAGQWSPCDERCTHDGPVRALAEWNPNHVNQEAQWRILTVHHLNGVKWDCRWWNLAALCQRCHLTIQGKVIMERVYAVLEHSEWFKPHAAGWYATSYLGEELNREETMARLDELLSLEYQG